MKQKLFLIVALICFGLSGYAQETPPAIGANFKQLATSQFYISLPDSAIWQYKGSSLGWNRLARYRDVSSKNYVDSILTTNYMSKTVLNSTYVPKAGGTMTGVLGMASSISVLPGGSKGALDLNNSDVIGMNAIWMADAANSPQEGLMWPKLSSANLDIQDNWDNLKGYNGQLQWTGTAGASFKGKVVTTGGIDADGTVTVGTTDNGTDKLIVGGNIRSTTGFYVTGGGYLYSPEANKLAINVGSADRLLVGNTGYVAIPGKLRIGSSASTYPTNIDNQLYLSGSGAGATGRVGAVLQSLDSTSAAQLRIANNKGEFFIMQTSGAGYAVANGANNSASLSSNLDMTFNPDADTDYGGTHDIYFKVNGYKSENTMLSIMSERRIGVNNSAPTATLDVTGTLKASSLGGTGSRMVVADAAGLLSTQAIPSGSTASGTVTSVSSANTDIGVTGGTGAAVLTLNRNISITGNASTATTLAATRTINGVGFNGSANISVTDDSKVPLTGGTVSGQLVAAYGTTSTMNQIKVQSLSGAIDETSGLGIQNRVGVMYDGTYRGLKFHTIDNTKPIIFANDFTVGAGEYARFTGDGKLGINNAAPAEKLDVTGNIKVTGTVSASGGFFDTSDIRLKNVVDSTFNVKDLKPIAFTWKSDTSTKPAVHFGYSAQAVQKVMPDAIKVQKNGTLTVNYIEVLVAKIKELEDRISTLEAQKGEK